jgi:hypothetical protein
MASRSSLSAEVPGELDAELVELARVLPAAMVSAWVMPVAATDAVAALRGEAARCGSFWKRLFGMMP